MTRTPLTCIIHSCCLMLANSTVLIVGIPPHLVPPKFCFFLFRTVSLRNLLTNLFVTSFVPATIFASNSKNTSQCCNRTHHFLTIATKRIRDVRKRRRRRAYTAALELVGRETCPTRISFLEKKQTEELRELVGRKSKRRRRRAYTAAVELLGRGTCPKRVRNAVNELAGSLKLVVKLNELAGSLKFRFPGKCPELPRIY